MPGLGEAWSPPNAPAVGFPTTQPDGVTSSQCEGCRAGTDYHAAWCGRRPRCQEHARVTGEMSGGRLGMAKPWHGEARRQGKRRGGTYFTVPSYLEMNPVTGVELLGMWAFQRGPVCTCVCMSLCMSPGPLQTAEPSLRPLAGFELTAILPSVVCWDSSQTTTVVAWKHSSLSKCFCGGQVTSTLPHSSPVPEMECTGGSLLTVFLSFFPAGRC